VKRVTVYISDYGKQTMELENSRGPQQLWTRRNARSSANKNTSDHGERSVDSSLLLSGRGDGIGLGLGVKSREKQNLVADAYGCDEDDDEQAVEEEGDLQLDGAMDGGGAEARGVGGEGDFTREPGDVGLVFEDELNSGRSKKEKKKPFSSGSAESTDEHVDEVAVRKYELQKLRYYFAVAEMSSVRASEVLYQELDGVELEHSAMAFDLRFVPDDTV